MAAQQGTADRDQALDALADELVGVTAACDALEDSKQQAEQQVGDEGSRCAVITARKRCEGQQSMQACN